MRILQTLVDAEADSGTIVAHLQTPVFAEDTIQTLADRHYENILWMLTNFDKLLNGQKLELAVNKPTMRMSKEREAEMIDALAAYKTKHAVRN